MPRRLNTTLLIWLEDSLPIGVLISTKPFLMIGAYIIQYSLHFPKLKEATPI